MKIQLYQSKGYALFLAVLPLVLMYKVPLIGLGVSTTLIAVGMLYAGMIVLKRYKSLQMKLLLPICLYLLFAMTRSNVENILLCLAILLHLAAMLTGAINTEYLKKVIAFVSYVSAIAVIIQVIVHVVAGIHIPLIANSLCLDELEYYSQAILTGIGERTTMYRPSAFFLEPSHMTLYCIVGLMLTLFTPKPDYKRAIIISIGILATTSGMGIVLTAGAWGLYPFVSTSGLSVTKMKRLSLLFFMAVVAVIVLSRMSFFQDALARITGPVEYSSTQYNAIWGRTAKWDEFIKPMSGKNLLWGYGNANIPDVYFTGLMTIIYSYGLCGLVLMCFSIGVIFFACKNSTGRLIIAMYGVMLTLADLAGFINMIFYFGIAIGLLIECEKRHEST